MTAQPIIHRASFRLRKASKPSMIIDLFNPDREALLNKHAKIVHACRHISQWTSDAEIAWLCEAAQAKEIVGEVGSYKGKSARAMALAGAKRIWCVDRFQDGTREIFCDRMLDFMRSDTVRLCDCESAIAADMVKGIGGRVKRKGGFDFFFIDASHAKEDVLRDIDLWMPLVKPGGILAFHDCHPNEPENGVSQALREKLPTFKLCVDSIAALRIPNE